MRPTLVSCLAALMLSSAAFAQTPAPAKLDRSGETALRAFFDHLGKVKALYIATARYVKEEATGGFTREGSTEMWIERPGKFAIHQNSTWGDTLRAISNGKTLLTDGMSDEPVELSDAPTKASSAWGRLAQKESGSFLILALCAPNIMEDVIKKDQPITFKHNVFTFSQSTVGLTRMTVDGDRPVRVEYINPHPITNMFGGESYSTKDEVVAFSENPTVEPSQFRPVPASDQKSVDKRNHGGVR